MMQNPSFNLKLLIGLLVLVGGLTAAVMFFQSRNQFISAGSEEKDTGQPSGSPTSAPDEKTYRIVTLLPRDAIPSINEPTFYTAQEADAEYDPDELVIGVSINGESKAYSTSLLDSHEIVNDELGGRKIAVTW
jgi:hypothetical protein